MSKVQYYCAATLDGYIADANDGIEWLTGYEGSFQGEGAEAPPMSEGGSYERFYEDVGALVSGSVTYEFVLEHTGGGGEWPYRGTPCWVLSSRDLPTPDAEGADVRIVRGDVTELSDEMVASAGDRNLWVVGGGNVASQFADAGLLDEVLITVVPVVLGAGKPLFERPLAEPIQLIGSHPYATGMVGLRYEIPPRRG
jgi:dihydrofolate reductase